MAQLQTTAVTGSLTVTGNITAQTLVVQTITSSVSWITGSTIFGSTTANTHQFTGSILQSGSLATFAGSVGIGSSSPAYKLDVVGNIAANGGILYSRQSNYPQIVLTETTTNTNALMFYDDVTSPKALRFRVSGSSDLVSITSAGDVGIGTTAPQVITAAWTTLEVRGKAAGGGGIIYAASNGATVKSHFYSDTNGGYVGTQTNHYFVFTTNNAERMRITAAGDVGIGSTSPS